MSDELMLRILDLRVALDKALREAEARIGDEVVLSGDYYWHRPVGAAFDMSREPLELRVGQLTEDLEELFTEMEPASLWHELGHLVGARPRDREAGASVTLIAADACVSSAAAECPA